MAKNMIPGCHFDSTDSSSNNYNKCFLVWVLPICPSIKRLIILKTRLKVIFIPFYRENWEYIISSRVHSKIQSWQFNSLLIPKLVLLRVDNRVSLWAL